MTFSPILSDLKVYQFLNISSKSNELVVGSNFASKVRELRTNLD
jgi:hypothetical protein